MHQAGQLYWNTKHEIDHIQGTGTFGLEEKDPLISLRGYRRAAENRVDWGTIKKEAVLYAVNERIRKLEARKPWSSHKKS